MSFDELRTKKKSCPSPVGIVHKFKASEKTVHFNFRLRIGRAPPDRAPCAGRVTHLEETIRRYADKPSDNVIKPEIGMSFDSLGEAYDFYNLYLWEIEFGIRYGKSRLNAERTKSMQEIVCGCSVSEHFDSDKKK